MSGGFKVKLWGTRGSLATPGPATMVYGGNTSCVSVEGEDGSLLVLDAGTGIRLAGLSARPDIKRVDLLLTHLHMDHVQGIAFFRPIRTPGVEVHIWGPASTGQSLGERLSRYLSPPLFPLSLRELECNLSLHEIPGGEFEIGQFRILCRSICHPDPSVGYRISTERGSIAYLPDHEPALGTHDFGVSRDWMSGSSLVDGVDLLIHDAQYTKEEYGPRVGWGHSSMRDAVRYAALNGVKRIVTFHHDPSHTDEQLDAMLAATVEELGQKVEVIGGKEGTVFEF